MKKFNSALVYQLYQEYYLNQAKRKGGNLLTFHGSRFQQEYGLGTIFNTALAKRSREAIAGGLVPRAGSGRKSTKRKVQLPGLLPFRKRKTVVLDQDQDNFQLCPKFKWEFLAKS